MYPLRMSHPQHGFTHGLDSSEVEQLKKAGWVEDKPVPAVIASPKPRGRPRKAA